MTNRIAPMMVIMLLIATSILAQESSPANPSKPSAAGLPAIHGSGTTNHLARFSDAHDIGDSAIIESPGGIFTDQSFTAAAVSGQIDSSPGIAAQGVNSTSQGSTSQDASWSSGIRGVVGSTNSPAGIGVFGTSDATVGDPVGVLGATASTDRGIGVRGHAGGTSGLGIGVLGESISPTGMGVVGVNAAPAGFSPIGMFGYVVSSDGGTGLMGRSWSATGFGVGVRGESFSFNGVGGLFENKIGGNIILGLNAGVTKLRVDGAGTVYADGGFQAYGADFAESVRVAGDRAQYSAGQLLVIDGTAHRTLALAQQPYSTLIAGIYSTKPGLVGSTHTAVEPSSQDEIPLAVVGIVPCKVTTENGPIQAGDLLVSSSSAGYAMRGTDRARMLGAVIGKAMEPLATGTGTIEVLVTLQ